MYRKRKVSIVNEEKENEEEGGMSTVLHNSSNMRNATIISHGPMYTIMSSVQLNENVHKKYVKEMKQLYSKMDHDAFMFTFVKMIKSAMEADESNEYAANTLQFCAMFVCSSDSDEVHPLLQGIFDWLLTTISNNPHIRLRLCQFVNLILSTLGEEAALDDAICDHILEYMLDRLRDVSASVRHQAILALQRLQVPDNPDDPVLRAYQFHLCSDPSPRVRQAVITSMGRNYHTVPYILDRLWDIDEKVRRHTYVHMSSFPVRSYKVSQRLTLLEQGLNDRSESVRKVVTTIMLKQWIESYKKDLIGLVSALKLDSNEAEINRFRKVTKQTLLEIFKRQNKEDLISCLPIEEEGELHQCVPVEKLTIEVALYWQCLAEFFQSTMAEEADAILPELSTFCSYVEAFCQTGQPDMDKFEQMNFQYILLSLMEILCTFDLGDEIGRGNLQKLIAHLLKTMILDEKVIKVIVQCAENLMPNQAVRMQFFIEIIHDLCDLKPRYNDLIHDRTVISELLANSLDGDLNLKLSSLKVRILELEEREMDYLERKDYITAQVITDEKNAMSEEYHKLVKPLLEKHGISESPIAPKVVSPESVLMSLQLIFNMIVSPKVKSLNPNACKLYNDFICRHIASNQIAIRDWALKCGTAFSMLYEALAKDVFKELYLQFFKNHNIRIWETSITCLFELLDRYGIEKFSEQEDPNKSKRNGRVLYKTLDTMVSEDEDSANQSAGVIYTMSHVLDTCEDVCIKSVIIKGFCRLILRGMVDSRDILEKLLLQYFNPTTDPEINQALGVFLEHLIQSNRKHLLEQCIVPTVSAVISAPYDSPLRDIKAETIARFYIDSTRDMSGANINAVHNKLALLFLEEMLGNVSNKELCRLLSKELVVLDINVAKNEEFKTKLKQMVDKLIKSDFDSRIIRCFRNFKDLVDGVYVPQSKTIDEQESDDETKEDDSEQPPQRRETTNLTTEADASTLVATLNAIQLERSEIESQVNARGADSPIGQTDDGNVPTEDVTISVSTATVTADDVSPSSRNKTTFGRENRVEHRSLRRSLNINSNPATPLPSTAGDNDDIEENGEDDGPSRPAKIRIEARIDSDEKKKKTKKDHQESNSKARRNLRYARRQSGNNSEPEHESLANTPRRSSEEKTSERTQNSEKQVGVQTTPVRTTRSRTQEPNLNTPKSVSKRSSTNATPRSVDRRKSTKEVNEDDDEIIPPSPHADDTGSVRTRRQKTLQENSMLRMTRSRARPVGDNLNANAEPFELIVVTPHRNRKRLMQNSPQTANPTFDLSTVSPLRKQLRTDDTYSVATKALPQRRSTRSSRLHSHQQMLSIVTTNPQSNRIQLPSRQARQDPPQRIPQKRQTYDSENSATNTNDRKRPRRGTPSRTSPQERTDVGVQTIDRRRRRSASVVPKVKLLASVPRRRPAFTIYKNGDIKRRLTKSPAVPTTILLRKRNKRQTK